MDLFDRNQAGAVRRRRRLGANALGGDHRIQERQRHRGAHGAPEERATRHVLASDEMHRDLPNATIVR